jgi:hypothetical protein
VLSVTAAGRADVYCLNVDEAHEFYANGVLVANCMDALRYWAAVWISRYGIAQALRRAKPEAAEQDDPEDRRTLRWMLENSGKRGFGRLAPANRWF